MYAFELWMLRKHTASVYVIIFFCLVINSIKSYEIQSCQHMWNRLYIVQTHFERFVDMIESTKLLHWKEKKSEASFIFVFSDSLSRFPSIACVKSGVYVIKSPANGWNASAFERYSAIKDLKTFHSFTLEYDGTRPHIRTPQNIYTHACCVCRSFVPFLFSPRVSRRETYNSVYTGAYAMWSRQIYAMITCGCGYPRTRVYHTNEKNPRRRIGIVGMSKNNVLFGTVWGL